MEKRLLLLSFVGGLLFCVPTALAIREKRTHEAKDIPAHKMTPDRLERKKARVAFWQEVIEGLKARGEDKNAEHIKRANTYLKRAEHRLAGIEHRVAGAKKMHEAGSLTRYPKKKTMTHEKTKAHERTPKVYRKKEPKEAPTAKAS
jgi:hypothetical protein